MAEYIEREKAIEEIDNWLDSVGSIIVGKGLSSYGELIGCIQDVPAADVAEVVRCKDCKYFTDEGDGLFYCEYHTDNAGYCDEACWVIENDFCSYGARMDGEGE